MAAKEASDYPAKRKRLAQELAAGKYVPGYLFYGEEDYLRDQEVRGLLKSLGAQEGDMNFTRFTGSGTDVAEVIETAMTMPFFAERRVIFIRDSGWFAAKRKKGKDDVTGDAEDAPAGGEAGRRLADYFKDPSPTAHIVFSESDVNRTTALFKEVGKSGFVLSCDPPTERELKTWVARKLSSEGLRVEEQAVDRLLALTAGGAANDQRIDMNMLSREIEKLVSYCMGQDAVRLADVDAVCSDSLTDSVFAMVDRMARGDRRGAMALYQEMLAMKQAPFRILALISRRFNDILQVSELLREHRSQDEIARKLSLNPYVVKLCAGWSGNFTHARLTEILTACAESETAVKRGRMSDRIAVESLIAGFAGGA